MMIGNKRGEKSDHTEKGDRRVLLKCVIMRDKVRSRDDDVYTRKRHLKVSIKRHAMTRHNQKSRIIHNA